MYKRTVKGGLEILNHIIFMVSEKKDEGGNDLYKPTNTRSTLGIVCAGLYKK